MEQVSNTPFTTSPNAFTLIGAPRLYGTDKQDFQCKRFLSESGDPEPAEKPLYWNYKTLEFLDLKDFMRQIEEIISRSPKDDPTQGARYALMRGEYLPEDQVTKLDKEREVRKAELDAQQKPHDLNAPLFKKVKKSEQEKMRMRRLGQIIRDTPRHLMCFDLDSVTYPDLGKFDVANPQPHVERFIASELGPDFAQADYVIQLSSSAGRKDAVACHLWFRVETPMDGSMWRAWMARRHKELGREPSFDPCTWQRERIHYVASPIFAEGVSDPVKEAGASRWVYVEGMGGPSVVIRDVASLEVAAQPERQRREARVGTFIPEDDADSREKSHSKKGCVGAFNRLFDIETVIKEFLSDKFDLPDSSGRVKWLERSDKTGGCWITPCGAYFVNNHSNNSPHGAERAHAFEMLMFYKFNGNFKATAKFVESLPGIRAEIERYDGVSLANSFDESSLFGDGKASGLQTFTREILCQDHAVVRQADELITHLAREERVFRNGNNLVEPLAGQIAPITNGGRMHLVAERAGVAFMVKGQEGPYPAPMKEVNKITKQALNHFDVDGIKILQNESLRPFLCSETGALIGNGYHEPTQTLIKLSAPWDTLDASIPETPTLEDAREAVCFLGEVLSGFEFASEDDRAAAIALLVTATCRPSFVPCPGFAILADKAQSGKTTLGEIAQIIAGDEPQLLRFADQTEIPKTILGALLGGNATLHMDNVPTGWMVNDPSINSLITSEIYTHRQLSTNKNWSFRNDRLFILNGNELVIHKDISTRLVIINLEPQAQQEGGIRFSREEPKTWVRNNLFKIVCAGLTVARFGAQNKFGRPRRTRFPVWERIIADAIHAAGGVDAVANLIATRQESEEEDLRPAHTLIAELKKEFGDNKFFTATDVVDAIAKGGDFPALENALTAAGCKKPSSKESVGRYLSRFADVKDKIWSCDGANFFKFVSDKDGTTRASRYQVIPAMPDSKKKAWKK